MMQVVAFTTATPLPQLAVTTKTAMVLTNARSFEISRSVVPPRSRTFFSMTMDNSNSRRFNRRSQASRRGSRERQRLRKPQSSKNSNEEGFGIEDEDRHDDEHAPSLSENEGDIFSSSFTEDGNASDDPDDNDSNSMGKGNYFQPRLGFRQTRKRSDRSQPVSATSFKRNERSTVNQEAARSAFDAVDKLFESLNPRDAATETPSDRKPRPERALDDDVEENPAQQRSSPIDKATWLANVRARAATSPSKDDSSRLLAADSNGALDVDATEADSYESARKNTIVGKDEIDNSSYNSHRGRSRRRAEGSSGFNRSTVDDDDDFGTPFNATRFLDSSFETLMRIARMGPAGAASTGSRRRSTRNGRDSYSRGPSPTNLANDATNSEPRISSRSNRPFSLGDQRAPKQDSASSLLGLTKEIISNQGGSDDDDDDYEETDDEMERTVRLDRNSLAGGVKRQQFPAVRRFGGQTRRILRRPDEWRPLTEEQVSNVTSDGRSLTGDFSGGRKYIESDCSACVGSGMETCKLCVGEGWLTPIKAEQRKDFGDDLLRLIDEVWSLPNLVVNSQGEAQCVRCHGVGKEFCRVCKGSGSAYKKGFDLSEKYKVFDIFTDTGDGPSLDDVDVDVEWDEDDADESDEDEGDDEMDMDTFQLYQGSPESFDFGVGKKNLRVNTKGNVEEEEDDEFEDDIDVVDESAELLATLEAMDLQDIDAKGPTLDERLGIRRKPLRVGSLAPGEDDDDDDVDDVPDALGFEGVDEDEDEDEDEGGFRLDLDDEDERDNVDEVASKNVGLAELDDTVDDIEPFDDDDDDFEDGPDDGFQEVVVGDGNEHVDDDEISDGVYKRGDS